MQSNFQPSSEDVTRDVALLTADQRKIHDQIVESVVQKKPSVSFLSAPGKVPAK